MAAKTVLAVDLGAESGRVMGVRFDGSALTLDEIHRFPNRPVSVRDTLHWDVLDLWRNIKEGVEAGRAKRPAGVGVDAWGVDFALLDAQGSLIASPVHYRDSRTDGVPERVFAKVPRREVFERTGIQIMQINTLYQIASMVEAGSPLLDIADTFLTIPDLFNYWLSGAKVCEYSNATTTQMFDTTAGEWAVDMLRRLDIPTGMLPEVVQPGTQIGVYDGIPVIAPACHDTGSAVAGVPATEPNFGYISSGTWSLAGIETGAPIVTPEAAEANVTNEGGAFGTIRLLKNIMGLWIVQQCRATWREQGERYSYAELVEMARAAPPLRSLVDPNDPGFLPPGDHPARVRALCEGTGQPAPQKPGETVRAVLESLALAYRDVFERLEAVSGQTVDVIHIIGGGSQNDLLNQMTADATCKPVLAGPVEATVIGNALVQLISLGEFGGLSEARRAAASMAGMKRYEPERPAEWERAFERYKEMLSRRSDQKAG
jgi:rhamnulokinase